MNVNTKKTSDSLSEQHYPLELSGLMDMWLFNNLNGSSVTEEETATHSSTLAWRIPGGFCGVAQSQTRRTQFSRSSSVTEIPYFKI